MVSAPAANGGARAGAGADNEAVAQGGGEAHTAAAYLPYAASGTVVHGFGRGGKKLNCATANMDDSAVSALPAGFPCGVYYGWAKVNGGAVMPMVMSVGWNPQFKNTVKTMESHILHEFDDDFYGSRLQLLIIGFIRPMRAFASLDELIAAIESDKSIAAQSLDGDDAQSMQSTLSQLRPGTNCKL